TDEVNVDQGRYSKRCLQALRHLSNKYHILPSSLIVREVIRNGHNPVGGGGFADIWQGRVGDQLVCIKVLRLVIEPDEDIRKKIHQQFCNEALLWRQLQHPNILPLLGVNLELFFPSFCLISPWMVNRDIITYLRQNPAHNRHTALLDIASGLAYLHSKEPSIMHGDIRGVRNFYIVRLSLTELIVLGEYLGRTGSTLLSRRFRSISSFYRFPVLEYHNQYNERCDTLDGTRVSHQSHPH
ncbi:hypothetical protein GYMLUDRAFT_174194, partial [Collybiopsis luxurians FD-317 M1]